MTRHRVEPPDTLRLFRLGRDTPGRSIDADLAAVRRSLSADTVRDAVAADPRVAALLRRASDRGRIDAAWPTYAESLLDLDRYTDTPGHPADRPEETE